MNTSSPTSNRLGRRRLVPEQRRQEMLDAAVIAAAFLGLYNLDRAAVAHAAATSETLVHLRLGNMKTVRRMVLARAIETRAVLALVQPWIRKARAVHGLPANLRLQIEATVEVMRMCNERPGSASREFWATRGLGLTLQSA